MKFEVVAGKKSSMKVKNRRSWNVYIFDKFLFCGWPWNPHVISLLSNPLCSHVLQIFNRNQVSNSLIEPRISKKCQDRKISPGFQRWNSQWFHTCTLIWAVGNKCTHHVVGVWTNGSTLNYKYIPATCRCYSLHKYVLQLVAKMSLNGCCGQAHEIA